MTRLILLIALLAGCAGATTTAGRAGVTGTSAPREAVERFFAAARTQDIQGMSELWGTRQGPAREQMSRAELEKRILIMQCYMAHDQMRILGERPTTDEGREFQVQLARGDTRRETTATAVPGPGGRWYVENVDLVALRDLCAGR